MDKQQWKNEVKENLKRILKQKPEAVYVEGNVFETYPIAVSYTHLDVYKRQDVGRIL